MSAEYKTFIVPDTTCERAGLTFQWAPRDKLSVYANKHSSYDSLDILSSFAPCVAKIYETRLDVLLFHPIVRKLINESNGVFLLGQKLAKQFSEDDAELRVEFIKLSKQYRCIIKACIVNLQEDSETTTDPDETLIQLKLVKVFYNVEFLWHLCEILYVDVTPGDTVLPQLLEWVQFHFFQCERRAMAMLSGEHGANTLDSGMELEHDYWKTIVELILQGRTDTVISLLNYHSDADRRSFKCAITILRTMPSYQIYGGLSTVEFNIRWKCWQNDVKAKLQTGTFTTDPSLEFIIKLISGDEDAFDEVQGQCETWYQFMTAWLLYTEPTVKSFDLCFHAKHSMNRFGGSEILSHTDYVIIALMESDLHLVIKLIEQTTENGWFAAHLTNLLFHCGCLSISDNRASMTRNLHETLLLDYASLLMNHESLWSVGVTYLDHCPTQGRQRLELLLPRITLSTETKALKIIQLARKRDLHDVVVSICKVMGKRNEARNRLGNALTWALRSKDSSYVTSLTNRFLQQYNTDGSFTSTDLLDNLGSCMMVCDRLTFLGKYVEFHKLYNMGDRRRAAALLVSLVEAKLAPKSFWMVLLMDCVPLLEHKDCLLTTDDLYKLMECLEELEDDGELGEKGNIVRLALTRNLSRSMVQKLEGFEDLSMSEVM